MGDESAGADVEVGILGRIRATVDGRPVDLGGPRQQALLAALASRAGSTVDNHVIIEAVWDGAPPDGAAKTFRSYVARLRRSFDRAGVDGATVVLTDSAGYRLDAFVDVDADLFEAEVARAREHLAQGELADAVRLTGDALDRWEGPAFGQLSDRVWAAPAAVRLEELRLGATELRARALLDADRVPLAVALLEELAAAEPYRETVARLHALALCRSGRNADAMRVLRDFRSRLVDEHGLDPSDQLSELESMILKRDPRLDRPVGGRRLRGYVLHEPIARSPLGTVHRAEQPSIGREVAVTVLPPERADDPDVVRAFEARLQAIAGLDHPHVLPVYDYWREPGGAYVVTRLPAGTIEQGLRAGRLTAADTLHIGEQVASALAAAHERGVVHGALGPDAVVVDERGDAFLWGFPLSGQGDLPAGDVAALASLVTFVAGGGRVDAAEQALAVDTMPAPVRDVLSRAEGPAGGPVVTAAGLAAALAAARTGADHVPAFPVEVGPNPYRGLAAFRETDADVFFGREALTGQLLARLLRNRAVAVVGPSGSGKSSVVRAGVLPRLRADGAFVTTMVPGSRPLAELEIALSRIAAVELVDAADEVVSTTDGLTRLVRRVLPTPGADLVLVVDQFEELFTLSDPTERDLFLTALASVVAEHDAPVRVVLTLRADFLASALTHAIAGPLIRDRSVMIGPLGDDELHAVIVQPAEVAGVAVEPALTVALVADAARAPGSLPMVQFALTEVFVAAADDGLMTLEAYRRIGGIEGVLGQRAEEVFASLDEADQQAAHALFQRLVVPAREGTPTRRRALRTELEHVPQGVIEVFGDARLLRFDREEQSREPTVEVSHEALFRAWPRLAQWIEEEADELRLLGHLTGVAADWDAGGREESELYRGSRLDSALDFAGSHRGELSAIEEAFLDAGRRRRAREEASAKRSVRRLRILTGGLALGLVLALVGGVVALDQRQRAQDEQGIAVARELAAASVAVVDEDPELGILLALEAVERTGSADGMVLPEVESALHRAVTRSRIVMKLPGLGGSVDWHPDGTMFVTEGPEESGLVDLRDARTGESVRSFTGHGADINDVAFSSDGSLLATTGDDGLVRVWDPRTGEMQAELRGRGEVWGVSFGTDGSRVAAAWVDEALVRVLDLTTDEPPLEIAAHTASLGDSTSFSPDGQRLAIADAGGVVVVEAVGGDRLLRFDLSTAEALAVAWSPDGRWIASGSQGPTARVTDAATGERHFSLAGHTGDVLDLDWHPDGTRLATGARDGIARVFEITEAGALERIAVAAREGAVGGVAFSQDGDRLLTGDVRVTSARVWDVGLAGGAEWANLPTSTRGVTAAAFTPDGDGLLVSGEDVPAIVWDLVTETVRTSLGDDLGPAWAIEVSPDGGLIATISGEYAPRVHVWDGGSGEEAFTVEVAGLRPGQAAWSPDGELLAVAGEDGRALGRVGIVDRTGEPVTVVTGDANHTSEDVAFSPDGQRLVTARRTADRDDPTIDGVQVWDWVRGEVLTDIPVFARWVAIDPTGTRIAATDVAGGVSVWDAGTAERLATLTGHNGEVFDVAFSPDGDLIATSGADGTVRLWTTESGAERLVLHGHDGPVWSVAFGPNGDRLVSTSGGVARVWALDLDDLVGIAESRLTRSLTDDECRQYLHVERCSEDYR